MHPPLAFTCPRWRSRSHKPSSDSGDSITSARASRRRSSRAVTSRWSRTRATAEQFLYRPSMHPRGPGPRSSGSGKRLRRRTVALPPVADRPARGLRTTSSADPAPVGGMACDSQRDWPPPEMMRMWRPLTVALASLSIRRPKTTHDRAVARTRRLGSQSVESVGSLRTRFRRSLTPRLARETRPGWAVTHASGGMSGLVRLRGGVTLLGVFLFDDARDSTRAVSLGGRAFSRAS